MPSAKPVVHGAFCRPRAVVDEALDRVARQISTARQRVDQHVPRGFEQQPELLALRRAHLLQQQRLARGLVRAASEHLGMDPRAVERAFQVRRLDREAERGDVGFGSDQDAVRRRCHVELARPRARRQIDDHALMRASFRPQQKLAQAGGGGAAGVQSVDLDQEAGTRAIGRGELDRAAQRFERKRALLPSPERQARCKLDDAALDLDAQPGAFGARALAYARRKAEKTPGSGN